ncbi:MAG: tRNA uridine-5-carboxymethylaminomethyl(34) synthesis GTPase MnmE, partial [Dehalococcoidia bacterium]
LVIDAGKPLGAADSEIITLLDDKTAMVVANKSDLPSRADLAGLRWPVVSISALTGEGLDTLEDRMIDVALGGRVVSPDAFLVTNIRHKEALQRAGKHLSQARQSLQDDVPDDFVTIDLTAALNALGEITGETVTDDLLNTIFSRFCVGK